MQGSSDMPPLLSNYWSHSESLVKQQRGHIALQMRMWFGVPTQATRCPPTLEVDSTYGIHSKKDDGIGTQETHQSPQLWRHRQTWSNRDSTKSTIARRPMSFAVYGPLVSSRRRGRTRRKPDTLFWCWLCAANPANNMTSQCAADVAQYSLHTYIVRSTEHIPRATSRNHDAEVFDPLVVQGFIDAVSDPPCHAWKLLR